MSKLSKAVMAFKPLWNNLVIRFLIGFPLGICTLQGAKYFSNNGMVLLSKISSTVSLLLIYYLIILSFINQMFDRIYSFHEEKNSANIQKNPLKFAFKHRYKIYLFYKWFFLTGIIYALTMMWFFD